MSHSYQLTRFCFQRALAFIYTIGFLIIFHQYIPLMGEHGILPAHLFMEKVSFWKAPSLFWIHFSDSFLRVMSGLGLAFSLIALSGFSEKFGIWFSGFIWFVLWALYLSFVNIGYVFYGFGWESILLETGFLAIFLGSSKTKTPTIFIWLLRIVLFKVMFGAGLIKIRGDECWRDLTCMVYHYETQPVPNPLSWFFHHTPLWFHKLEVIVNHVVELIIPFGFFMPGILAPVAGGATIIFHIILIMSGNLSWLNYITLVLCIPCFSDHWLKQIVSLKKEQEKRMPFFRRLVIGLLSALILFLNINPLMNFFSKRQIMNTSFDPFHIVGTYGAFGSITRTRYEVILQGTTDLTITSKTKWDEYEFKCKPGDISRMPCLMSPYHYRLDWQIWFTAMNSYRYHPWMLNFIAKLLKNDPNVMSLIRKNPFTEKPPTFVRAEHYQYRFTTPEERRKTGDWWVRKRINSYLPPLSLKNPQFLEILRSQGWEK